VDPVLLEAFERGESARSGRLRLKIIPGERYVSWVHPPHSIALDLQFLLPKILQTVKKKISGGAAL
jgi:hypothetical protein